MKRELRAAIERGVVLTACVLPLAYLIGASLEELGAALAIALAIYYAWRGE